jgi:predicted ATP-dependent endonuclease of OLD family
MSNTIGFKNFRKFTNFPEIDLGDITILVGGNNAGKSTLVKAMLLMRDFLKSRVGSTDNFKTNNKPSQRPHFSFDTEHVNIGDFYRAFCRHSPHKENTISFTMKIDSFRFIVSIRGERKPGVLPEVSTIGVSDDNKDVSFVFDFDKNQMTAHFGSENTPYSNQIFNDRYSLQKEVVQLNVKLKELRHSLSNSRDLLMITDIKSEIAKVQLELVRLQMQLHNNEKALLNNGYTIKVYGAETIDLFFYNGLKPDRLILPELIRGFARFSNEGTLGDKRSKSFKEEEAQKNYLRGKVTELEEISRELESVLNKQVIEYIYAHSVFQDSIYANCANSSDYTKRAIHEFYTSRISQGDEEFELLKEWLEKFKIGISLKAIPYKGDNYSLVIFDKENPEITSEKRNGYPGGIDLADKGMGSIQIVILLLRLVTLIRKYKGQQLSILLEEPEQNLHPAMQSKLSELIYEINTNFGVRFVIETHSEYLIRKSQVIVANANKSLNHFDNPFRCYYLPDDGKDPYMMIYRNDGKFSNEFGPGFFDEANNLLFDIL